MVFLIDSRKLFTDRRKSCLVLKVTNIEFIDEEAVSNFPITVIIFPSVKRIDFSSKMSCSLSIEELYYKQVPNNYEGICL